MNGPKLSIMIPAVFERGFSPLYGHLLSQIKQISRADFMDEVEVLVFFDNRMRSTGLKRQALLAAAQGDFVTCLDDDDWVADDYISSLVPILTANLDADVVVFDSESKIDEGNAFRVHTGVEFENEQCRKVDGRWKDIVRNPWHWCAWNRRLAKAASFPDGFIDDDWYWLRQMIPNVKKQVRIDKVLHYYRYNQTTSLSNQGKPTT